MSDKRPPEQSADVRAIAQRRWWLAGVGILAVLAVIVVAALAGGSGDDGRDASSTAVEVATSLDGSDGTATTSASDAGSTLASDPAGTVVTGSTATASTLGPPTTLIGATSVPGATVPFEPGSLETVTVQTVVTAPPVAIDDEADAGTGMSFRLDTLEAVQGEATGPGEIAGPAVRVTVVATNDSAAAVLLEGVVVDLTYGPDKTSAAPLSGPGVVRFEGEVAPGSSATAVYVFDVPVDQRAVVSVLVSYLASVSPVVFEGPAPTA